MTTKNAKTAVANFMNRVITRNPGETEFHEAIYEMTETIMPFILQNPQYQQARILERLSEPDRVIIFRVSWQDDKGNIHVNRAYRVQYNNAIGPYKGGLRFHPSVNLSILKFLGFEQTFKNGLTDLPLGGAKGGSDFDPKDKSDNEVMRFCQALMTELSRHIGKDRDVPAGDIGVGAREIGYLFGQHKRLNNNFTGVITGKGLGFGGSPLRVEATGYGCVYFVEDMLKTRNEALAGKTCLISGSGNVAQYTAEKIIELGGKVVTMSDSSGFIYDPNGIDMEKLAFIIELKNMKRGRIEEYAKAYKCEYFPNKKPWEIKAEVAFPSATQNEIDEKDAQALIKNGIQAIGEGANMPCTIKAMHAFTKAKVLYAPSKAANAGGVAVSGLEQIQNSQRFSWSRENVDKTLRKIMRNIHNKCMQYGFEEKGFVNYVKGANIASFKKIADAMIAQGVV